MNRCPTCNQPLTEAAAPPEPPVGTWVRDRHGATTMRQPEGWAPPGYLPGARWEAMWEARGPYVKCKPWGRT